MNALAIITILFILYAAFLPSCHAQRPIYNYGQAFDPSLMPVLDSRIFRVPEQKESAALKLLKNKAFVKLDAKELAQLFDGKIFDTKAMIAAQAKMANDYALKREKEALDPFFSDAKHWMIKTAKDHRKLAEYTLKLPLPLQPWLVVVEGHFEDTGGFDAQLAGATLKVQHGSLGSSSSNLHKIPVVIFVEKEIKEVQITSSVAR